ncbi:MAG TPA: cupredoxin domain-containing protein [Actinomycetota bacterium]|jgi:uncharacterized cupredoxin-like copper-binding protein|nr:cupredoxin domain-containing protein [Actinomycetota bacterium]
MRRAVGLSVLMLFVVSCATSEVARDDAKGRTVVVTMRDNHFEPDRLEVRRGETIAFRFVNRGRVQHDAFLGDEAAQQRHEAETAESEEDHGDGHAATDADAITVKPGDSGRLTHTFDSRGTILIGCHEPGHYDDGMVVKITVG